MTVCCKVKVPGLSEFASGLSHNSLEDVGVASGRLPTPDLTVRKLMACQCAEERAVADYSYRIALQAPCPSRKLAYAVVEVIQRLQSDAAFILNSVVPPRIVKVVKTQAWKLCGKLTWRASNIATILKPLSMQCRYAYLYISVAKKSQRSLHGARKRRRQDDIRLG